MFYERNGLTEYFFIYISDFSCIASVGKKVITRKKGGKTTYNPSFDIPGGKKYIQQHK